MTHTCLNYTKWSDNFLKRVRNGSKILIISEIVKEAILFLIRTKDCVLVGLIHIMIWLIRADGRNMWVVVIPRFR